MRNFIAVLLLVALSSASAQQTKSVSLTNFQRDFLETVYLYKDKYSKADNELKKSALVSERTQAFKKLKGDPLKIKDWYGVLKSMGTNSDGKAYVEIEIGKDVTVKTWNNAFSDSSDKTLIPQKSFIYQKLSDMKEGNVVKFSGRLKRFSNLTEAGKMESPDILFLFSDIEKVGDQVAKK